VAFGAVDPEVDRRATAQTDTERRAQLRLLKERANLRERTRERRDRRKAQVDRVVRDVVAARGTAHCPIVRGGSVRVVDGDRRIGGDADRVERCQKSRGLLPTLSGRAGGKNTKTFRYGGFSEA
jgi:hypothetical protein